MKRIVQVVAVAVLSAVVTLGVGCGGAKPAVKSVDGPTTTQATHDHGGWWCAEHGVPEAVCAQCDAKVAADFQKKGDWCKQHDRPESQCFLCHPDLEAKFAAEYEAKEGKKPPKPKG